MTGRKIDKSDEELIAINLKKPKTHQKAVRKGFF